MLTADLVSARRFKGELRLQRLEGAARKRAEDLAEEYLQLARIHVGASREELDEAWNAVDVASLNAKVAAGLRKLVDDTSEFDAEPDNDPALLRREVFLAASERRRTASVEKPFRREDVLEAVATRLGLGVEELEKGLYADLKGAHRLRAVTPLSGRTLVESFDLHQAQAVLLRAVRVVCTIHAESPGVARAFFRKLKFLRLMPRIQEEGQGRYRVEVDGPFSLFESVTKYGLSFALLLPSLSELDAWALEADIRWGKEREPLVFRLAQGDLALTNSPGAASSTPDDVKALLAGLQAAPRGWCAQRASKLIHAPGLGVIVPDLELVHEERNLRVYVELLGYWSREAVFRRVEMAAAGHLKDPILFVVSSRLRVGEDLIDEALAPASLYVYKGTPSPRLLLGRVDKLVEGMPAKGRRASGKKTAPKAMAAKVEPV